jgi:hypothetical protein
MIKKDVREKKRGMRRGSCKFSNSGGKERGTGEK